MATEPFESALRAAERELVQRQRQATELVRALEANQAEIKRYELVVASLRQLLNKGKEGAMPTGAPNMMELDELERMVRQRNSDRHTSRTASSQSEHIAKLLLPYPMGLPRQHLEELMIKHGVVGEDVQDERAAITSALWRAVKSGTITKDDGDIYRLPIHAWGAKDPHPQTGAIRARSADKAPRPPGRGRDA